ncbi:MAG TPA: CoA pyrophosphatase [Xanthomonadaceae bacterium]|nr:CoA pyrophosphatase [Xanthomonadaceae bacterium]
MSALLDDVRLRAALHPLAAAPAVPCWNLAELDGLLPDAPPVEAAVLVGLVPRVAGTQVLLTRRTEDLRHHAGQVSFPGGRVEPGDRDAVAAALRETEEEVGIATSLLSPLGFLDPLATVSGFRVLPVVALVDAAYRPRPDPREVAEVFEVPLARLLDPASLAERHVDWRGRPRVVLEFVNPDNPQRRIWGATASILHNLRQRMERAR